MYIPLLVQSVIYACMNSFDHSWPHVLFVSGFFKDGIQMTSRSSQDHVFSLGIESASDYYANPVYSFKDTKTYLRTRF